MSRRWSWRRGGRDTGGGSRTATTVEEGSSLGNAPSAVEFFGKASEEPTSRGLANPDPYQTVIVAVRAVKASDTPLGRATPDGKKAEGTCAILGGWCGR